MAALPGLGTHPVGGLVFSPFSCPAAHRVKRDFAGACLLAAGSAPAAAGTLKGPSLKLALGAGEQEYSKNRS